MLRVKVEGLSEAEKALRHVRGAACPTCDRFWRELGETLADDAQARWPLRRRTGKLRASLTWAVPRSAGAVCSSPHPISSHSGRTCFIRDLLNSAPRDSGLHP